MSNKKAFDQTMKEIISIIEKIDCTMSHVNNGGTWFQAGIATQEQMDTIRGKLENLEMYFEDEWYEDG